MSWSCFRPKTHILTTAVPVVPESVVSAECVVSASVPVVVVKPAPCSDCCKQVSSGCCKPVSCSGCSGLCKKASETPLISSSTPQLQVQQEKSDETAEIPGTVPVQASSTQASS